MRSRNLSRLRRGAAWVVVPGLALLAGAFALEWLRPRAPARATPVALAEVLRSGATGYAKALEPRTFEFPADHGPHAGFRTEWWYLTGNLSDETGRAFGFQWTVFRHRLSAQPPRRTSAWAADTAYMGHFALTDVAACRFHAFERFARGALDLAGAQAEPFRVWVEDWEIAALGEGLPPLRLHAAQGDVGLELEIGPGKPLVLQGENGLSRKGDEPGNASYYYSFTRLPARGTVVLDGERRAVSGTVWMDREWSTSALGREQSGWDWFALQLSDGSDLMAYRLRRADGSADPASAGSLADAGGRIEPLAVEDLELEVLGRWTSPRSGVSYPSGWRLRVPRLALDLTVQPRCEDQELELAFRYWEGAVTVTGARAGRRVEGVGYVELTGYEARKP